MTFIQNINSANGFMISVLGIAIVFTCLLALCFVVEFFHKVIFFVENKTFFIRKLKRKHQLTFSEEENFADMVTQFIVLVKKYDEISLPKFFKGAKARGLTYFYPVVAKMVDEKYLITNDRGFFILDKEKCEELKKSIYNTSIKGK